MAQLLITVDREFGSGGREIAETLGKRLGLKVYDNNMLDELQQRYGLDKAVLSEHEEIPVDVLFSRKSRGNNTNMNEVVAQRQFQLIKEKADKGESFVVVGRCGEHVLRHYAGRHSFFVRGDELVKCRRVMARNQVNELEAMEMMTRIDRQRRTYHNYYCDGKWGDSRNYDLCVNSSVLGVEGSAALFLRYLELVREAER